MNPQNQSAETLAASTIRLDDISDDQLRSAVQRLRNPKPSEEGLRLEVGEMYVSGCDELHLVTKIAGERAESNFLYYEHEWEKSVLTRLPSGRVNDNPSIYDFKRLAKASDIPPEVDISIVPERIRKDVSNARAKSVCESISNQVFGTSTPSQPSPAARTEKAELISSGFVVESTDGITYQIEPAMVCGEAKLVVNYATTLIDPGDQDAVFDLADGRSVGVSADMSCGKPVLSVTELEAGKKPCKVHFPFGVMDCVHESDLSPAPEPTRTAFDAGQTFYASMGTLRAVQDAIDERKRQDEKFGEQNLDPIMWSAILSEEVGEFSQAAIEKYRGNEKGSGLRAEAVQCAAVALAIVESIDRQSLGVSASEGAVRND